MDGKQKVTWRACGAAILLVSVLAGCATETHAGYRDRLSTYRALAPDGAPEEPEVDEGEDLFEGDAVLEQAALVEAVLARSPTLESARQAWRAALEEVPQRTALEDPMIEYTIAPLSVPLPFVERDVPFGQSLSLSQQLPFPGKLEARGAMALAEADALEQDVHDARLSLALLATQLWADYIATARSLDVNEELAGLLTSLRESAEAHLATGHSLVRDPLKAEVSLAELERERVALLTQQRVLAARLNGLLHRRPDAPLPPPPADIPLPPALDEEEDLLALALEARPELAAADASLRGAAAAEELAKLAYVPEVSLSGEYSSMFDMVEHQWMVGVGFSLPVQFARREAEAESARARMARAKSERARLVDEVRTEVATALEREREAREVVRLYEERLVPAAVGQLEATRASLEAGTEVASPRGYFDVLEAEEDLRRVRLAREVALADLLKRRAELERALGKIPGIDGDIADDLAHDGAQR